MPVATDFASSDELPRRTRGHISNSRLKKYSANYQLNVKLKPNVTVKFDSHPSYLGICLDRSLSFSTLTHTQEESFVTSGTHQATGRCWLGSFLQSSKNLLLGTCICSGRVLCPSAHTKHIDVPLDESMRVITGCLRSTPSSLPILSGISLSETRRSASCLKLYTKTSIQNIFYTKLCT